MPIIVPIAMQKRALHCQNHAGSVSAVSAISSTHPANLQFHVLHHLRALGDVAQDRPNRDQVSAERSWLGESERIAAGNGASSVLVGAALDRAEVDIDGHAGVENELGGRQVGGRGQDIDLNRAGLVDGGREGVGYIGVDGDTVVGVVAGCELGCRCRGGDGGQEAGDHGEGEGVHLDFGLVEDERDRWLTLFDLRLKLRWKARVGLMSEWLEVLMLLCDDEGDYRVRRAVIYTYLDLIAHRPRCS